MTCRAWSSRGLLGSRGDADERHRGRSSQLRDVGTLDSARVADALGIHGAGLGGDRIIEVGVDPALGGGCALVAAHLGAKLSIVDAITVTGLNRTEEILELVEDFAVRYRPSVVIIEMDAQQKGLGNDDRLRAMAQRYGFAVRPHLTRGVKADEIFGVASMDQSFRKCEISIPWKDQSDKDRMNDLVTQLRSWRPDIKTKHLTQDLVMALWFIWRHWRQQLRDHYQEAAPAWRPDWIVQEGRLSA